MAGSKLLLFEAIELRNEFDRTIKLLEKLLGTGDSGKDIRFFRDSADGEENQHINHSNICRNRWLFQRIEQRCTRPGDLPSRP